MRKKNGKCVEKFLIFIIIKMKKKTTKNNYKYIRDTKRDLSVKGRFQERGIFNLIDEKHTLKCIH